MKFSENWTKFPLKGSFTTAMYVVRGLADEMRGLRDLHGLADETPRAATLFAILADFPQQNKLKGRTPIKQTTTRIETLFA